jgi:Tfp pilus assembly protein PilF
MKCPTLLVVIVSVLVAVVTGCTARKPAPPLSTYQTVGKDPRRDTETARAENLAAVPLIAAGDYAKAEAHLKASLTADIMYGPAHNNLGKVYFHQNKLYLAAWEFEYAAKVMPYQAEPRNNMGLVFEAAGKLDDAVAHYEEALKLEPENPQVIGNAARTHVRRGDNDPQTRELLERIVMRDDRPDWVAWARRRLALAPASPVTTQPSSPQTPTAPMDQ